jgi:hypothetical protein
VGALVLDDGERRICIVALDVLGTPGAWGRRLRKAVADTVGCAPEAVLVNSSHTHAAPPPPGMLKIGGTSHELRPEEQAFADQAVFIAGSAASLAAQRLRPAVVGAARARVDGLGVNRRQRTDGDSILGWNPDGVHDRDVSVIRVDAVEGDAIATLVAYGCHTVVLGWDVEEISSDFAGPLRRDVRDWSGGDCLFLQGCAGNVLPLEAFFDQPGPERKFGKRLALSALQARGAADPVPREPRQQPTASAVPIAIWRLERSGARASVRLDAAEELIELPFLEPRDDFAMLRAELLARVDELQRSGAGREAWNPVWIHAEWARRMAERPPVRSLTVPVQALRIGEIGIVGWPCEPFAELGLALRARGAAPFTVPLGYTNDLVGYVATPEEYPYGGYEPSLSQRHFGNAAPFAPDSAGLLVDRGAAVLEELFGPVPA